MFVQSCSNFTLLMNIAKNVLYPPQDPPHFANLFEIKHATFPLRALNCAWIHFTYCTVFLYLHRQCLGMDWEAEPWTQEVPIQIVAYWGIYLCGKLVFDNIPSRSLPISIYNFLYSLLHWFQKYSTLFQIKNEKWSKITLQHEHISNLSTQAR